VFAGIWREFLEYPLDPAPARAAAVELRLNDITDDYATARRAIRIAQLGHVAQERFRAARAAGQPGETLLYHLNAALKAYQQALDLTPTDNPSELGDRHGQLGTLYADAGHTDTALHHYQQAIRYGEQTGNRYGAGQTRYNIALALALARAGRTTDALRYAHAALRDYQTPGPAATTEIQHTQQLISRLGGNESA
jgi:tetratricopeptide (TPR) repeat protein